MICRYDKILEDNWTFCHSILKSKILKCVHKNLCLPFNIEEITAATGSRRGSAKWTLSDTTAKELGITSDTYSRGVKLKEDDIKNLLILLKERNRTKFEISTEYQNLSKELDEFKDNIKSFIREEISRIKQ